MDANLISSVYQPIVELDTGCIVAYEALARGPSGTNLELPDRLFAAAAESGLTAALDWMCQAAALEGALTAGWSHRSPLFINVEPSTFRTHRPTGYDALFELAESTLDVVIEVTERALMSDPAALIVALSAIRSLGMRIAIDDVGADPASLALLPFVEPDVIKLDLRLVQRHTDPEIASIATAVRADAERRGATILAEGIETEEHLARALVLGARLGQGWLFGRPGPLPTFHAPNQPVSFAPCRFGSGAGDPMVVGGRLAATTHDHQRAADTNELPRRTARRIRRAVRAPQRIPGCTALHEGNDATLRRSRAASKPRRSDRARYADATNPGVRGGSLPTGHPLTGEWTVTVVGPHDAVALIATDCGDETAESQRRFEYVITHDRPTVVAAARSLMQYIDAE